MWWLCVDAVNTHAQGRYHDSSSTNQIESILFSLVVGLYQIRLDNPCNIDRNHILGRIPLRGMNDICDRSGN